MNRVLLLLLAFVLTVSCKQAPVEEKINSQEYTNIYFIRHAEKDRTDPEESDPELTVTGKERANYWAKVMQHIPLSTVYSTNYRRTLATAEPTAAARELSVTLYDPAQTDPNLWWEAHRGESILVVGHSNTTPALVNQLLGETRFPDIEDDNNGQLYLVQRSASGLQTTVFQIDPY